MSSRAYPEDLSGCSHQTQLVPQPAADILGKYARLSSDPLYIACMQSRFPDTTGSHMRVGPDDAHIRGEQYILDPADAGKHIWADRRLGLFQKSVRRCGIQGCVFDFRSLLKNTKPSSFFSRLRSGFNFLLSKFKLG